MLHLFAQVHTDENKLADFIDKLARTPLSQVVYFVAACTIVRICLFPMLLRTKPHQRAGGYAFARIVNESLDAVVYAGVFVFLLIRPFCIQAFKIPTGSMLHTLEINDFIVANKAIYRYSDPRFKDIVVFKPPKRALQPGQGDVDFIKRCIGTPGDLIEIKGGMLYRNGVATPEPYVFYLDGEGKTIPEANRGEYQRDFKLVHYQDKYWPLTIYGQTVNGEMGRTAADFFVNDQQTMDELLNLPPAKIPAGYYLMMGDNRFNSFDSRGWGLVPRDDIIGRSEFVWFPFTRWGMTR